MPGACQGITLVNVAPNGMRLILEDQPLRGTKLGEVLQWINADKRAGGTVLFARVGLTFSPTRIERCLFTEVTFDRHHVVSGCRYVDGWSSQAKQAAKSRCQFNLLWRQISGNHRDCVVGTLSRAIETTNASFGVDIDMAQWIAEDCSSRTTRQTLGIFAVQANLWEECVLQTFGSEFDWSFDLDAAAQQSRLAVNLVAGQRTIAAAHAKIHVHYQQIGGINNS